MCRRQMVCKCLLVILMALFLITLTQQCCGHLPTPCTHTTHTH